jgi:hypothetical protein
MQVVYLWNRLDVRQQSFTFKYDRHFDTVELDLRMQGRCIQVKQRKQLRSVYLWYETMLA